MNDRPDFHAVTPYGPKSATSRVRVLDWLERIPDRAQAHTYAGLLTSSPSALFGHPRRVVAAEARIRALVQLSVPRLLVHREASPLSRGGLESRLLRSAELAVYDFDDALQCDTGEGPLYRRLAAKSRKALVAVQSADRVIAGNDALANWASMHNQHVVVIPSCVDLADYEVKSDFRVADPPRLGWIGSSSTEVCLQSITETLLRLHAETGARLTIVGTARRGLGQLEQIIDRVPWSIAAQRRELARFDIGLMPLENTCYMRGKCGYKLLQYLAAGVVAVASPVGVNAQILKRAGLPAATTAADWADALRYLLNMTASSRADLGARARKIVMTHYSFDAWQHVWRAMMDLC